jgi:acyl-coenzyme A synthetase/AMP-(fatty) acid ligase/thioesterase domain-containing protein/acyl carrier protein
MLWERCDHWALCQPDRHAIITTKAAFSYAQLNQTINRVAAAVLRVRDRAGGGQIRALLLVADPFQLVAAMIGVEKAGACHVSLNVSSPPAFLQQIADDVEPAVILAETTLTSEALALAEIPLLTLDQLPAASGDSLRGACTLDDPYCILYTSGSSGRPKGVIRNRYFGAVTVARDMGYDLIRQTDDVLCAAAPTSGFGHEIIRNALAVGATLYLPQLHNDWLTIARHWLETGHITFLGLPPSLLRTLFAADAPNHIYDSLEIVSVAGEAALASDFALFKRHSAPGALLNVIYGSSEGGIYSLEFLGHDSVVTPLGIPLGRPLGYVEIAIVDEELNRLAADQVGEIIVRSPMTADGYWKMPELTAQKFLPDPDGGRRRIYRTGDLGKIAPDGTISFLGRVGDEVKVNSNRVSLSYIENVLRGCPGVANVIVQPQARSADGSAYLAGYYVATHKSATNAATLRDYLRERVPGYMIPSHFIRLDAIPLNPSGKVNRFALPKPDETQRMADQPFVAPRSDVERKLATVWSGILGVKEIGVNDRFTDLGGDSLQAVNMLLRVNGVLGTTLDISALNQVRTIAELTAMISEQSDTRRYPPYSLLKEGSGPPLFLFHAIGGNILVYQPLAARLAGNMPVYGILAQGLNEDEMPLISVPEIARHHIRQMKALQQQGPYYFGGYSFGGIVAYEVAQQLRAAGDLIGLVLVLDATVRLPKILTAGQRLRETIQREFQRVIHHLRYFASHAASAWVPYARELFRRADRVRRNAALRRKHEADFGEQVDRYLDEVDQVASAAILAVIDAHHLALSVYRPALYGGNVVVVLAQETNFEGMEGWKTFWREAVQGNLEFMEVPGNHLNMLHEPQADILATRVNSVLARALAPTSNWQ